MCFDRARVCIEAAQLDTRSPFYKMETWGLRAVFQLSDAGSTVFAILKVYKMSLPPIK